jgi:hypothetical protein
MRRSRSDSAIIGLEVDADSRGDARIFDRHKVLPMRSTQPLRMLGQGSSLSARRSGSMLAAMTGYGGYGRSISKKWPWRPQSTDGSVPTFSSGSAAADQRNQPIASAASPHPSAALLESVYTVVSGVLAGAEARERFQTFEAWWDFTVARVAPTQSGEATPMATAAISP